MPNIHRLDAKVLKVLRSQVSTVSLASAVTDLVQNSIDAEATEIKVLIDVTRASFMVCDNGKGICPADLDKLGLHNVTSKISSLRDLTTLKTYGFRGEAIFCIASVSHVTVASKVADCNSGRIRTLPHSSRLFTERAKARCSSLTLEPFGMEEHGTKIVVEDLLYNTPVRRKIIESDPAYKTHVAIKERLFQLLVLHPEIQLQVDYVSDSEGRNTLFASNNVSARLTPHQKLSKVFLNTFGTIVPLESLRRVSAMYKKFKLNGIISKNAVRTRDFLLIYINGREYHNVSILKMIDKLFQRTVFENSNFNKTDAKSVGKSYANHAVVILDIRCPHNVDDLLQDRSKKLLLVSNADVLHPLILKVINSFLSHEGFAHSSLQDLAGSETPKLPEGNRVGIKAALSSQIRVAKVDSREIRGRIDGGSRSVRGSKKHLLSETLNKAVKRKLTQFPLASVSRSGSPLKLLEPDDCGSGLSFNANYECSISRSNLKGAEVINQIGKKFILLKMWPEKGSCNPNIVVADQHASDERIKLETYLKDFINEVLNGTIQTQSISDCVIEVSHTELELFRYFKEEFFSWGICYHFNHSSESAFIFITSLPSILNQKFNGDKDYLKGVLQQMVQDMKSLKKLPIRNCKIHDNANRNDHHEWTKYYGCIPQVFHEIFKSKACRSAIMFGDMLSRTECSFLIKKLAECWIPFQCAHGRPSIVPLAQLGSLENEDKSIIAFQRSFCLDYDIE
ncbi:hypothetical protein HG536_0A07890 [Torulaspora globosa]|uniref:MutL C-terminal dimerisation domain-containing protein n=1 Tax=Torulaspora globosa TaxID=48254 RepID=A0A7G3ZBT8_9SACH|nr:uncharacterized protein HG536_0A07890 [Torulaspora globosa]QLL30974.1 hypothetical protein HG536_0A07890 [Torulaspora globosa]